MNRRFYAPFARIDSSEQAQTMRGYAVWAFILWSGVSALNAVAISGGAVAGADSEVAMLKMVQAMFALGMAALCRFKPNPVWCGIGVAWMCFELSSALVDLLVGASAQRTAYGTVSAIVIPIVLLMCGIAHAGALRAANWLIRKG